MKLLLRALSSLLACFAFAAAPLSAQSVSLVEGARKEGRLVWYTSMAVDTSKPLLDAFLRDHPFIKADLVRLGEEQLMTRILGEVRGGKWGFDVMSGSAISTLVDRGIIAPYLTPGRAGYRDEFMDPQGYWTGVFVNNLVLAYNTSQLPAKEAPRDYTDLLDPKWKGKMLMDSTDYDWYGTLLSVWGRERTIRYMKQLARQEPQWRRGHGLTAQLVAAGETPLAWAYSFRIERMKKDGAPVDWIETFDPIVTTVSGIGLSARPTNPNAAKLFIDFVTSTRAQMMIREMRRIPARSDVKPLAPKMDQSRLKLKAVPKEVYLRLDEHAREFRQIFGL
ncbi:MAG TPA: extracellular solute-binding protein [candidate division Zixibacteria bacterium]|nr:extracellular solute-binding protein [candidate division Zixibacteria bacterium]